MKKQVTYHQGERGNSFDRDDFYPGDIPAEAGVYVFRNRFGRIIYVGKAADLRRRMSGYFQPSRMRTADPKLRSLINSIHTYEYYPVKNESESLILESQLIKEYSPRYNVLMRDDKRFLLIKINQGEAFPCLQLARVRKNDDCLYFGPFPKGGVLRKTIDFLIRRHGLRVCRSEVPSKIDRKHCLASTVKDCCEPCIGKTSREEYMKRVDALMGIFNGNVRDVLCEIRIRMQECVEKMQYEKAAEFRDMADNINNIFGMRNRSFRFAKVAGPGDEGRALNALQKVLDLQKPPGVIECFDVSNTGGSLAVAGMVCFVNGRPDKKRYRRFRIRGDSYIAGRKEYNAAADISKSDCRMPIADYPRGRGGDDTAMIAEAVSRRYGRVMGKKLAVGAGGNLHTSVYAVRGSATAEGGCNPGFPDLIMVDGGRGQLNAVIRALKMLDTPFIPLIGLAKKNEEIFVPGMGRPLVLERRSPALKLVQAIRDESHRFAINYHRELRNSRIEDSILDDIPGIGPQRKKALLKAFGSLKKLRKANFETIIEKVPGIGAKFAQTVLRYLS